MVDKSRDLHRWFEEPIVRKLTTDTEAQNTVMKEFEKLKEDRVALRSIFPSGNSRVRAHTHSHGHNTHTHMSMQNNYDQLAFDPLGGLAC